MLCAGARGARSWTRPGGHHHPFPAGAQPDSPGPAVMPHWSGGTRSRKTRLRQRTLRNRLVHTSPPKQAVWGTAGGGPVRTCVPQAHLCRLSLPPSSLSASGDLTARRCPDSPALFGFRLETLMWVQLLCSWRPVLSSRSSAPCRGFLSSLTRANPTEEEGDRDPPHAPECRR